MANSDAANRAVATFQQAMQSIANTQRTSQDALNVVVHSTYNEAAGHQATSVPKNSQGSFSDATGHVKEGF